MVVPSPLICAHSAFHDVLIRTGRSQQLFFVEECWNSSMPHQRIGSALVASFALLSFMRSASPMPCPRRSSLTESALVPPPGTELIFPLILYGPGMPLGTLRCISPIAAVEGLRPQSIAGKRLRTVELPRSDVALPCWYGHLTSHHGCPFGRG